MTDAQRTNADEQRVRDLFERALRTGAGGRPPGGARSTNCTAPARSSRCTRRSGSARARTRNVDGWPPTSSTRSAVRRPKPCRRCSRSRPRGPYVMSAIGIALGHRHDPRAIGPLRRWRAPPRRGRPLRGGTRPARPGRRGGGGDARRDVVDPDHAVRDWVTFGLAHRVTTNTPAVRDALAARLYDPNTTRGPTRSPAWPGARRPGRGGARRARQRRLARLQPGTDPHRPAPGGVGVRGPAALAARPGPSRLARPAPARAADPMTPSTPDDDGGTTGAAGRSGARSRPGSPR